MLNAFNVFAPVSLFVSADMYLAAMKKLSHAEPGDSQLIKLTKTQDTHVSAYPLSILALTRCPHG